MNSVKNALPKCILISNCYFWTDSQVTLSWIKAEGKFFKRFVENRVCKIRKDTDISKWFFCDTKSNPADILTRLKVDEDFQNNLFWWKSATFSHEKVIVFKESNLLDLYHEGVSTEIKSAVLFTKVHTTEFNIESVITIDLV